MRGKVDPQQSLFAYFSPENRVPEDHPLRTIKQHADAALKAISRDLDGLYGGTGRTSTAPWKTGGQIWQSRILIAESSDGDKV